MRVTRNPSSPMDGNGQQPSRLAAGTASAASHLANPQDVNAPTPRTTRVWRTRSMQQIANSVLAASANVMHAIVANELAPGQILGRHQIAAYGANMTTSDARSVLRTMVHLGLVEQTPEGDWTIAPQARQTVLQSPSLNWAQDHHAELQRVKSASWPRSLEEYTAIDLLASLDIDAEVPLSGHEIQAEIRAQGARFSDERKRSLMQWLVKSGYAEQVHSRDAFVVTPAGADKARRVITEFAGAHADVADRVQGRAQARVYGGVGNLASSKPRQQRLHEISHQFHSRILQEVKEGTRVPGEPFPVHTQAAAALGMPVSDLKNVVKRLMSWGIVEKQGPGQYRIALTASNTIAARQDLTWRANNATRLQKTADDPEMPGTWAQQALLELIAGGDIRSGDGFPSKTSIQKAFQANGQAFGPKGAENAMAWLKRLGLITEQKQGSDKLGYAVAPDARTKAEKILNDFRALESDAARPLVEIPAIYVNPLKPVSRPEVTFAPGLHNSQHRAAIFAHLLAKVASGELNPATGLPSSIQAIAKLGLPGKVLIPAHSHCLVEHNIIPQKEAGQTQTNAHRDITPLLPGAQAEINASPYLRWLAANAPALSSITDARSPLNEAEYAVLEMIAGRKYQPPAGLPRGNLLGPKALQDRGILEAEINKTPEPFRTDSRAQYCQLAIKKYQKLGLIHIDGPTKKQLAYTRTPNAQARAQQLLEQFDLARDQAVQRAAGNQSSANEESRTGGYGPEQSGPAGLSGAVQGLDLQSAINASLRESHALLRPNQIQQNNLPSGHHWHNPSPDGNCLFHALARRFPNLGSHAQIRSAVATAAQSNAHIDPTFREEFVAQVRQPGEYVGAAETAIQVAAEAFGIRIRVIVEDGSPRFFGPPDSPNQMVLARNQDHFFLMEPIPMVDMAGVFDDEVSSSDSEGSVAPLGPIGPRRVVTDGGASESPPKRPRFDRML